MEYMKGAGVGVLCASGVAAAVLLLFEAGTGDA